MEVTETPLLTRTNSMESSTSAADSHHGQRDADLLGVQTDLDGAPIEAYPTSTMNDLFQTFFAKTPHLDMEILDRKLRSASDRVRQRVRNRKGESQGRAVDGRERRRAEIRRLREKVSKRIDKLNTQWDDAKTVRLREKICFSVAVMNLVVSSLIFATRPEWMALSYTIQTSWFLPLRIYSYTRRKWTYFLFDYCYFSNVLNLVYLWIFPQSQFLFTVAYCAAHGPLAFSIATWRNSAVFHSLEKMCSLFIHLYPPIVFTAIRHFMDKKEREAQYPALQALPSINAWTAFTFNVTFYLFWQLGYFILITKRKADKIASGERINSYSTMAGGKGPVAKLLKKVSVNRREFAFMLLQMVYTIICTLPAPLLFYNSKRASAVFILFLIVLSVWNGAGYYVEVLFRKSADLQRELEALKQEIEAAQAAASSASGESEAGGLSRPPTAPGSEAGEDVEADEEAGSHQDHLSAQKDKDA